MTVFVVCKEQLVAGLLRGCLEQAGLGPVEIRDGLDHLPENDSDATVLLHDNQPADDIHDRIVAHRARAPRHRFILVTRDPLPDGEAERLESLVSAMLTSDCTSDALVGAVSVVRAGFHLTRDAGAAYAAPRLPLSRALRAPSSRRCRRPETRGTTSFRRRRGDGCRSANTRSCAS